MWFGIIGDLEGVVIMAEKGELALLDRNVTFIAFCFEIVNQYPFLGDDNQQIFEETDPCDLEVTFEVVYVTRVNKI
jgi:hypothetical protein